MKVARDLSRSGRAAWRSDKELESAETEEDSVDRCEELVIIALWLRLARDWRERSRVCAVVFKLAGSLLLRAERERLVSRER